MRDLPSAVNAFQRTRGFNRSILWWHLAGLAAAEAAIFLQYACDRFRQLADPDQSFVQGAVEATSVLGVVLLALSPFLVTALVVWIRLASRYPSIETDTKRRILGLLGGSIFLTVAAYLFLAVILEGPATIQSAARHLSNERQFFTHLVVALGAWAIIPRIVIPSLRRPLP